ncbi:MAG: cytochrome c biogenesis protein CcsA [Planctomycetes bacterium]|nr:cytochrome c biogenesis protein CcsA [Planctomycetota bacterium]
MMKLLCGSLLVALLAAGDFDYASAGRIAIQHRGRVKPLDSFAREFLQRVTGSASFRGYRDPETGRRAEVFRHREPVAAILHLVAQPQTFRTLRFIRVDHPEMKKAYGLPIDRVFFSIGDFEPARGRLEAERRRIDPDEATSAQRAVLELVEKQHAVQLVMEEQILSIVPIPFGGELHAWMTPTDVKLYLSGAHPTDPRFQSVKMALDAFIAAEPGKEAKLRELVGAYERMKEALVENRAAAFNEAVIELSALLKTINSGEVPSDAEIERELWYNSFHPFGWASAVFFLAALLFIGSYVFGSRALWGAALAIHVLAMGLTAYGYGLRWLIADRYPLANHYESMIAVAFGAALISLIAELILRKHAFGLSGATVACLMIVLGNTVPAFASQAAISTIMPALQTFWMTIHVPVILTGYAGGAIIWVLGHVYLFSYLFRKESPDKQAALESLDGVMYRALQVTVLFLLAGIILGAVWAGEAWGRPWGWDMKEVWALITFLAYLAMLHGRFTGYVRGLGTALGSLGAFALLVLCYYGVNFLFGKGLHTYGFGSGEVFPLVVFFAAEAALAVAAALAWMKRRPPVPPELIRE